MTDGQILEGREVEIDANEIGRIIFEICDAEPWLAAQAASRIIDYLIVRVQIANRLN